MKNLTEFIKESFQPINEERLKENVVLWGTCEIDPKNEKKTIDELTKMFKETINRIEITALSNIEAINKKNKEDYETDLRKAAEYAASNYKSVMKMTPEKQQAWIEDKIKEIDTRCSKPYGSFGCNPKYYPIVKRKKDQTIEFTPDILNIKIRDDIHSQHSCKQIKWKSENEIAQNLYKDILSRADFQDHCKTVFIYSNTSTIDRFNYINISFGFDDEFEDELDNEVRKFGEFMSNMYNSGRYMGD